MRISKSPLTAKEYIIPERVDDRDNLATFLSGHEGKPVVVVQGLGFVGSVMSLICANATNGEYAVIGVDLPSEGTFWKIKSLNEGVFPLIANDPKIQTFYERSMATNSFYATCDNYAYSQADVIIVDVNLDVQKSGREQNQLTAYDVDLSSFRNAVDAIGMNCKPDALILVETTVPPGTCEKIVRPAIEKCLVSRGLPAGDIRIGHSYERVMPGKDYVDSIQSYYRVYSGVDEESADATEAFLKTIIRTDEFPLRRLGNTNATEMAKVLENSYRAMNIAFIVEWTRFAEEAGVNLHEVVDAIRMRKTHSNMMLPAIGVGGYCLTKDPLLASWGRQNLFGAKSPLGQSEVSIAINDRMPLYAFEFLRSHYDGSFEGATVLLLGVSYRQEVGDTRHTPVELLYDCLQNAGAEITLHDPHVMYWEEKDLSIDEEICSVMGREYDIIVISTGHSEYNTRAFLEQLMAQRPSFFCDMSGLFSDADIQTLRTQHSVKVLGRGDL
jgi:UDP-N-acetyl-D-glucosamine dehydrogenase